MTGNQQLQQTGQALTNLGLLTKGLAHLGKWKHVNKEYDCWNKKWQSSLCQPLSLMSTLNVYSVEIYTNENSTLEMPHSILCH